MKYEKYQFFCVMKNDTYLPPYKGSTFRGVFGIALKKVVCALKQQECSKCLLKEKCIYALVFETGLSLNTNEGSRIASPPHPFVLEPPLTSKTKFSKGDLLDFTLLLFGEINNSLPYFIYAFDQMGKIGIGKKIEGKRGRFTLKEVKVDNGVIYSEIDQKLHNINKNRTLSIDNTTCSINQKSYLKLTFETPLRIKFANHLKADLPFHVLVRSMLRRVSSLLNCYGDGEPAIDYKALVKRAEDVQTLDSDLKWFDFRRYSSRQNRSMLMGGITGTVTYEGDIEEYLPFVEFCEKVHLGKQTSFGLGKVKREIL